MPNRQLLLSVGFLILSSAIFWIFAYTVKSPSAESFAQTGIALSELIGLTFILGQGRFYKTLFFKIALASMGLFLIGSMFKIMHWPGAVQLLIGGLSGVLLSYAFYFVFKKPKTRLDFSKLAWISVRYMGGLFVVLLWNYGHEILLAAQILFWIILINVAKEALATEKTSA